MPDRAAAEDVDTNLKRDKRLKNENTKSEGLVAALSCASIQASRQVLPEAFLDCSCNLGLQGFVDLSQVSPHSVLEHPLLAGEFVDVPLSLSLALSLSLCLSLSCVLVAFR